MVDDGLELGNFDSSHYFSKPGEDSMDVDIPNDTQSIPLDLVNFILIQRLLWNLW